MQKVNDPAVRHTSSGALIRRFLPYLAKYKKTLFIDLFCAAMTTLCDIILPKIMSTITMTKDVVEADAAIATN